MPYLQLDVPNHYRVEVKRSLARRLGDIFVRIMQTRRDLVTVAFREWAKAACGPAAPANQNRQPCSHAIHDRPSEQRAELAQALIDACVETLALRSDRLVVELTQHSADEMYRAGPAGHRVDAGRSDERGVGRTGCLLSGNAERVTRTSWR